MTNEELDAYSRGQCDAYNAVFNEFITAFANGCDIHWLRERITAQCQALLATVAARGAL